MNQLQIDQINEALRRMYAQGERCFKPFTKNCFYTHPDDPTKHCIVGHLLEVVSPKNQLPSTFVDYCDSPHFAEATKNALKEFDYSFLILVQLIHDSYTKSCGTMAQHFIKEFSMIKLPAGVTVTDEGFLFKAQ